MFWAYLSLEDAGNFAQDIATPQFDASVEAQPGDYPAATVPQLGETDTLDLDNLDLVGNSRFYGFGEGNFLKK